MDRLISPVDLMTLAGCMDSVMRAPVIEPRPDGLYLKDAADNQWAFDILDGLA